MKSNPLMAAVASAIALGNCEMLSFMRPFRNGHSIDFKPVPKWPHRKSYIRRGK